MRNQSSNLRPARPAQVLGKRSSPLQQKSKALSNEIHLPLELKYHHGKSVSLSRVIFVLFPQSNHIALRAPPTAHGSNMCDRDLRLFTYCLGIVFWFHGLASTSLRCGCLWISLTAYFLRILFLSFRFHKYVKA